MPTAKHGEGSLMIWGCFSLSGVGHICRVEGSINFSRYQNIIKTYMLPSCTKDVIFQQDNAPPHTSRSTKTWFQKRKIKLMDWSPQSPDLNPIETLCKKMEDEMTGHKPRSKEEFWETMCTVWNDFTADKLKSSVMSVPLRSKEIRKQKVVATKY